MAFTENLTICIILTQCCLVVTLLTFFAILHFSCKRRFNCRKYRRYEKPLKKRTEIRPNYTELNTVRETEQPRQQQGQHPRQQQRPQQSERTRQQTNQQQRGQPRNMDEDRIYSDIEREVSDPQDGYAEDVDTSGEILGARRSVRRINDS